MMSEFDNCIFKDCKWFSKDFEQNCSGYGDGEPAIASCKRFAEIQPILDRLETTTKMHERACNDIQEYTEQIEAKDKEIEELHIQNSALKGTSDGIADYCKSQAKEIEVLKKALWYMVSDLECDDCRYKPSDDDDCDCGNSSSCVDNHIEKAREELAKESEG